MPTPEERLSFLEFAESDLQLLGDLEPVLEKHADALVSAFYRHLLSFPATRRLLRDPAVKDRLLRKQRAYLISLAQPSLDEAYLAERRRIGEVHERVGLDPSYYLGAYGQYMALLTPLILEHFASDPGRAERAVIALHKRVALDAQLAMETYIERRESELEYLATELSRSGRELAHDLEAQGAELRRTAERAKHAERLASIATLVAGLAHEIGTPMGVIQGHARMLEANVENEQGRWRLQTIREQIDRISRIMQSLLNMARPSTRDRIPIALAPLIQGTLGFLREKLERRGIGVEAQLGEAPPVRGDPERLQQLLLNLFLNAADAMEDGGELRVSLGTAADGDALVTVSDTGTGIADADLARVFDPFFTTKPAGEGNGLGLAVAHGIVADHGGEITVSSRLGEGTAFSISLPARLPSEE